MASIILSPKNDDYHHHHNLQQQQQRQHPQLNLSVENLDSEQLQQSKTDIVSVEIKNFDQTEFEIEENNLNENQNVMNRDDFSDNTDQNILDRTHLDSLQNDVEIDDDKPRDNVNDLSKECDDNFQIFVTENSVRPSSSEQSFPKTFFSSHRSSRLSSQPQPPPSSSSIISSSLSRFKLNAILFPVVSIAIISKWSLKKTKNK
ncbi:hypothetical protein NH340_JMT03236 [Sarcoptes scabiei]|nr:hypothetical protein NH340_JMT03236 [Sarcoptes scabiei]